MAHHALVDTCVWIELVTDPSADEIIARLEDLVATTHFQLVVPKVVKEEFDRNKVKLSERLAKNMSNRVRDAIRYVSLYGDVSTKASLISGLQDFMKRIGTIENAAAIVASRIDKLIDGTGTTKLEITDEALRLAAVRGYLKRAPFTSNKNSVADAIILEAYLGFFKKHKSSSCTFSFITLNHSDFSDPMDERLPHSDLGEPFATGAIKYANNLGAEINRLTEELPNAPERKKSLLSDEIVRRVHFWDGDHLNPGICPSCGAKALINAGWRGYTWHMRCTSCNKSFDTGESIDD